MSTNLLQRNNLSLNRRHKLIVVKKKTNGTFYIYYTQ